MAKVQPKSRHDTAQQPAEQYFGFGDSAVDCRVFGFWLVLVLQSLDMTLPSGLQSVTLGEVQSKF